MDIWIACLRECAVCVRVRKQKQLHLRNITTSEHLVIINTEPSHWKFVLPILTIRLENGQQLYINLPTISKILWEKHHTTSVYF